MVELRFKLFGFATHQPKDQAILTVLHAPAVEVRQWRSNSAGNSQQKPEQAAGNCRKAPGGPLWHLELVGSPSRFIIHQFFSGWLRWNNCFGNFPSPPTPAPATSTCSIINRWFTTLATASCFDFRWQDSQQCWAKISSGSFQHKFFGVFHWTPTPRYNSKGKCSVVDPIWRFRSMNVLPGGDKLVNMLPPEIHSLCDACIIFLEKMFLNVFSLGGCTCCCLLKKHIYELQLLTDKYMILAQQTIAVQVKDWTQVLIATSNCTFHSLSPGCLIRASIRCITEDEYGMLTKLPTPFLMDLIYWTDMFKTYMRTLRLLPPYIFLTYGAMKRKESNKKQNQNQNHDLSKVSDRTQGCLECRVPRWQTILWSPTPMHEKLSHRQQFEDLTCLPTNKKRTNITLSWCVNACN